MVEKTKQDVENEAKIREGIANLKAQAYDAIREIDGHTMIINQIRVQLQNINEAIGKIESKLKEVK